jgi:hypothetical protein
MNRYDGINSPHRSEWESYSHCLTGEDGLTTVGGETGGKDQLGVDAAHPGEVLGAILSRDGLMTLVDGC